MNFIFSKHALEQLKNRNIPESSVKEVVENPDKIIEYDECIKICQSIMKSEKLF